jgi:hypothetical protein
MHIVSSSFLGLGFVQLALYLVTAFSFYKLANIRRIPNAWLAFIPFFQLYIVGYIGDTLKYNTAPFNRYLSDIPLAYALPLLSILSGVVGIFPLIGFLGSSLLSLLVFVGEVLVYLFVFEQYAPQNKFLFTVLSLIPVVGPCLILYSIRDYH